MPKVHRSLFLNPIKRKAHSVGLEVIAGLPAATGIEPLISKSLFDNTVNSFHTCRVDEELSRLESSVCSFFNVCRAFRCSPD